jgi:hypothetical protein
MVRRPSLRCHRSLGLRRRHIAIANFFLFQRVKPELADLSLFLDSFKTNNVAWPFSTLMRQGLDRFFFVKMLQSLGFCPNLARPGLFCVHIWFALAVFMKDVASPSHFQCTCSWFWLSGSRMWHGRVILCPETARSFSDCM